MQGRMVRLPRVVVALLLVLYGVLLIAPITHATIHQAHILAGPKSYYLALGDSLAFGYQPDLNWSGGYSSDFYRDLKGHGVRDYANLACPGETTMTMIKGGCPYAFLRKSLYASPQLQAALAYLHKHAGQVSPVTLDIGGNDMIRDINPKTCAISPNWEADLAAMDADLTRVILPQLVAALTVNNQLTGDLLLMNYYDPFQNTCPTSVPYVQEINQHLATDAAGLATTVDIFTPFGGTTTPDPHTCALTWMCSAFKDIHAQDSGYRIIATAFEQATGY